jgi:phage-related tail fiber protein
VTSPSTRITYVKLGAHDFVGEVVFTATAAAPSGYLKCNGAAVSRTVYADLFAAIGTTYGAGDGSTTFNVPDLRGEFLRCLDDGRGVDSARTRGSAQAASRVAGEAYTPGNGFGNRFWDMQMYIVINPDDAGISVSGAASTQVDAGIVAGVPYSQGHWAVRPRNVALLACIRY